MPIAPTIGRVVHLPFMPSRGSVGAGMSAGAGASQFGGDQTLPCGFSVLRSNWQEARAMLTPPREKFGLDHLDAQAVADQPAS